MTSPRTTHARISRAQPLGWRLHLWTGGLFETETYWFPTWQHAVRGMRWLWRR